MANNQAEGLDAGAIKLLEEKLALFNQVFQTTQQELLLIDIEGLTPLLERKDRLIAKIEILESQEIRSEFERVARTLYVDGKIDLATVKRLVAAHKEEMEAGHADADRNP